MNLHRLGTTCLVVFTFLLLYGFSALAEEPAAVTSSMEHELSLGYQVVSNSGNPNRAAEYHYNEPGATFGLDFRGDAGNKHLLLEGVYLNTRDYYMEAHLDLAGKFKINLGSERLWHNLDHIPYQPGSPESRPASVVTRRISYEDANPSDEYGLKVEIDEAEVIAKIGNYPAHVRLKYWRLEKEGQKQLRFADKGHDLVGVGTPTAPATGNCDSCHLASATRKIDRVTEEVTGGFDAHVGFFDLSFDQLFRTFRVKDPLPEYEFFGFSYSPVDTPRSYQHSEDPESSLTQSTVKLRTALTGGLVGDGAYTYGRRENNSDLAELDGVSVETDYQKVAGNLSYTPLSSLTVGLRYRFLDLETETPDTISAAYVRTASTTWPVALPAAPDTTIEFPVRDNIDLTRYEYAANVSWRPVRQLTVKGDIQREIINRSDTGGPDAFSATGAPTARAGDIDPFWELPEKEIVDQYRLGLSLRPLKTSALKVNSWYRYTTSDNPAYAAAFDDKQEVFLGVNYGGRANWGVSATARGLLENNDDFLMAVTDDFYPVLPPVLPAVRSSEDLYISTDREKTQQNYDVGLWMTPFSKLTTGVNCGYVRTKIEQNLLYGTYDLTRDSIGWDNADHKTDYLVESRNISAYVNLQLAKTLATRVSGYYLRSQSTMNAKFYEQVTYPSTNGTTGVVTNTTTTTSSAGLEEISRLDIRQQGLSVGLDWNPAELWTIGLNYTFDDYESLNSNVYDGSTQTVTASLSRSW